MTSKEALDCLHRLSLISANASILVLKKPNPKSKEEKYRRQLRDVVEKELEALQIIIKRKIDITDIMVTTDNYELYKACCKGKSYVDEYICTKKEFKLLCEVLAK